MTKKLYPFWVSWYDHRYGDWELHWPWWIAGQRCTDDALTICAAVMAKSESHAKKIIIDAHDKECRVRNLDWRFVEIQEDGWSPFNDRFQRRDWMQWHNKQEQPDEAKR